MKTFSSDRWIISTVVLVLTKICLIHSESTCSNFTTKSDINICTCNEIDAKFLLSYDLTKMNNCIEIEFENSTLNIIPTNFFAGLGSLQKIYLNESKIGDIEAGAFSAPIKIEALDLSKNHLKHVARGWFNSLAHLKHLKLNFNRIEKIEDESFHGLHSLKYLSLSNNKLTFLPENWFISLNELEVLDISCNSLKTIDFKMHNFNHLKKMNFSKNNIELLNDCAANTTIDSSNGTIKTSCFPKSLEYLDLASNFIVNVENNSFDDLRNLTYLGLDDNKLNNIPLKLFISLERLKHLSISHNDLHELKVGVFSGPQNLNTLYMSLLQIKDLDVRLFTPINRLSNLDISWNNLEYLNDQIFSFCPQLESINIQGNRFPCSVVASIVIHSRKENFTVNCSRNFDTENIIGIPCIANVVNANSINVDRMSNNDVMYNIFYISGATCLILVIMLGLQVYSRFNQFGSDRRNHAKSILTI